MYFTISINSSTPHIVLYHLSKPTAHIAVAINSITNTKGVDKVEKENVHILKVTIGKAFKREEILPIINKILQKC